MLNGIKYHKYTVPLKNYTKNEQKHLKLIQDQILKTHFKKHDTYTSSNVLKIFLKCDNLQTPTSKIRNRPMKQIKVPEPVLVREHSDPYLCRPYPRPADGGHQENTHDGVLGFRDVDSPEAQRPGHVGLPMGTIKKCHSTKALQKQVVSLGELGFCTNLEKHPSWIVAQLDGYSRR